MKKLVCLFLSILFALNFIPMALAAQKTDHITEDINIITNENASATQEYAAGVLSKYLSEKTDKNVGVNNEKVDAFLIEIAGDETLEENCFEIKSTSDGVIIKGGGNRGCIYGAYYFLEEFAGYRCFTSSMGMISYSDGIKRPVDTDIKKTAYFEYTDTDWLSPTDEEYSLMNGLNGGVYRDIPAEKGGTVDYISSFCHTLTTQFCSADKYFGEHPEYFALHDGSRNRQQLCLTNEDTYNTVLSEIFDLLKEKHDPDAALQIISVTQNDSGEDGAFCECENCKATDDENDSHAGTMITFVNRIADAVRENGYDNVAIDTFAYRYTRHTPLKVRPADNVIVRLCSIECCFSHTFEDTSCARNEAFMDDLKAWSKICNRLYIWDYATNYANTLGIFPDFGVLQTNMRTLYDHHVKGVYSEGNYYMSRCNTEFGELRSYLISRLMKDPLCDYYGIMDEFLEAYYGNGWQNIREFIDMTIRNAAKGHVEIYSSMADSLHFTEDEIAKCDEFWEMAKKECTDQVQLENIRRSELSWRYWKASVNAGEFSKAFGSAGAREELFKDIEASGAVMHSEGSGEKLVPAAGYRFLSADNWFDGGNNSIFTKMLYSLTWILFAAIILISFVMSVKAVKLKKYLYIVPLPLLAACSELFMWNRRAYLAWRDIGEYGLTVGVACAVFAFVFLLCANVSVKNKILRIISPFAGAGLFMLLYELPLIIINVVIFNGKGNNLAYSVAVTLSSILMLAVMIKTTKKLR